MLVAFLVSKRKIHTTMSGYQVLRSVLQFLGEATRQDRTGFSHSTSAPLVCCPQIEERTESDVTGSRDPG